MDTNDLGAIRLGTAPRPAGVAGDLEREQRREGKGRLVAPAGPRCQKRAASVGAVLALLIAAPGFCAGATPASNDLDRATVVTLVMNAVTQVRLCGLAIDKSRNADIQSLCRKASADSARTALAGMQLAQTIGATDAKLEPAPETARTLDTLAQFSGHDFDREFLLAQIESAEEQEHTLRYEIEVTSDMLVKRYESTVLPKIEHQLERAETALRGVAEAAP